MHVARVRHVQGGRTYTSVLLRQSYREGRSVRHRTLASLTALPPAVIDAIERSLRGERLVPAEAAWRIVRSTPHGHVAAVLGTLRSLGLEALLDRRRSRSRDLAVTLVVARLLAGRVQFPRFGVCGTGSMRSPLPEGTPCCSRSCTSWSAVSSEPAVADQMRRRSSSWCSGTR